MGYIAVGHRQKLESPFLVKHENLLTVEQNKLTPLASLRLQEGDQLEVEKHVLDNEFPSLHHVAFEQNYGD